MNDPKLEEIKNKVRCALRHLFERDRDLFDVEINERTITHKFAEYLQYEFPDYNVDCEYNRHKYDKKILKIPQGVNPSWDDTEARTVYPDIVIHKRKTDFDNLVVIEVKKSNSSPDLIKFDERKLKAFTKKFNGSNDNTNYCYDYGFLIKFDVFIPNCFIEIFKNGEKIENGIKCP